MSNLKAVILAAGKGTRMKSELPKVLHKIYDRCAIDYVCDACENAGISKISIVVGHKKEQVIEHVEKRNKNIKFCIQEQQLGTGHAVMQAKDNIADDDIVLVINGDQPLISARTIKSMISFCIQGNYGGVVLSGIVDNPGSLGRVIRDQNGNLNRIVERKDCNEDEERVKEVNIGVYCFNGKLLKDSFDKLDDNNAQNEYYITDIPVPRKSHMVNGVTLIDPASTYISIDAKIGKDTIIYPGTNIQGETVIGENCVIGPNSHIISSQIGNNVTIETSKVTSSKIADNCNIGPFAHIRPNCDISNNCKVGSFAETKNVTVGSGTKIPHLIYTGDATIGNNVEIACGVITANMNTRWEKNRTEIKDGAFIGCNSTLIAPITVGEEAVVGAGSVITKDVPDKALALERGNQIVKDNYKD